MIFDVFPLSALPPDILQWWMSKAEEPGLDIYFHPRYVQAVACHERGQVMVALARDPAGWGVYPFVRQAIGPRAPGKYDIVSVFEFGGPCVHLNKKEMAIEVVTEFKSLFHDWCVENGVISEFIRVNPFLEFQELIADNYTVLNRLNYVIDLFKDIDVICSDMSNKTIKNIKIAKKRGCNTKRIGANDSGIDSFMSLYTDSMNSKGADQFYYFDRDYIDSLLSIGPEHVSCFETCDDLGDVAAIAIFLHGCDVTHYHLGATRPGTQRLCPTNDLLMTAIRDAKVRGHRWFHLGGAGVSQTGLHAFKAGFTQDRVTYRQFRKIHDPQMYAAMMDAVRGYGVDPSTLSFFPVYRDPSLAEWLRG